MAVRAGPGYEDRERREMRVMMRPLFSNTLAPNTLAPNTLALRALALGALALLAACASQEQAIQPASGPNGGDAFALEVRHVSGTAAVQAGLDQAQTFCGEHGRLFVMTDSQVGSRSYRLEFRCVSPSNVPPPPVVASAPPPPPARAPRGRRATQPREAGSGPPLRYAASLPDLRQGVAIATPWQSPTWQPATANVAPINPPVTTRPLFAPPPGQALAAAGPPPRRMPPPDDSPMVLLPRLGGSAIAASPTQAPLAGLPPVRQAAPFAPDGPRAAVPPMQAQSLPVITPGAPLPGFGMAVPSPNPLPGAPSSLPPIAGGSARPMALPSSSPSGFATGTSSFMQGFR